MSETEAEGALTELARELVGELAGGKLLSLALAKSDDDREDAKKPAPARPRNMAPPLGSIGGRRVQAVLEHPESPTLLYDLGAGCFAEGLPGGHISEMYHSQQFIRSDLAAAGWKAHRPQKPAGEPAGK